MPPSTITSPEAPTFEGRPLPDPAEPVFDQGLAFDVETLLDRRRVLKIIGLRRRGGVCLAGLRTGIERERLGTAAATSAGAASRAGARAAACAVIPEETADRSRATARTAPTS